MRFAPDTAEAWCAWARTEHGEGRLQRAETGFRNALSLDAASAPARYALAALLLETGDVPAAAAIAAPLIARIPDHHDVLWLSARLAQARGDPGAAGGLLTRLLRDGHLTSAQRAEAMLSLGLAQGELGDAAGAFASAAQGKRLQRELHADEAQQREGEVAKLKRLSNWLDTTPQRWSPLRLRDQADGAAGHIFLIGFPRSGTTLLEQVLASHSQVATLEEAPMLAAAYQAFLSDAGACASLLAIESNEATAWADHYWNGVRQHGIDFAGRVFVDKQPAGTLTLPIIARLFPHARILFALRDPRDVVLSCFRQAFQINAMTYAFTDLAETAACYDACMTLAETARERLPLAWRDVRHEALIDNFESELSAILDFLGLNHEAEMADFARIARSRAIRTPSATQVRAGLNRRGLRRWEEYRNELAPVLPQLAPWVERFGYR